VSQTYRLWAVPALFHLRACTRVARELLIQYMKPDKLEHCGNIRTPINVAVLTWNEVFIAAKGREWICPTPKKEGTQCHRAPARVTDIRCNAPMAGAEAIDTSKREVELIVNVFISHLQIGETSVNSSVTRVFSKELVINLLFLRIKPPSE
jgi:hypothetical protein